MMLKKILVAAVMVMCGCVLNAQTITPKSTLKGWFITGAKPTQEQFWNWMDSYWHKDETIPVSNVSGLPDFMSYVFVRNDTLYGVKSDTAFFIAVINSDNVTVDSNNVKYNLLDTASQPHDDVVSGNKYLILNPPQYLGDGITANEFYAHKNNIATYTGGIYNYVVADTGDIVSVANPTTTFYKYSGNAWQLIRRSATIGGDNINAMVDIGARGDTAMRLIAGGKAWVRVGKHGNVHLLVFKNAVPRNNVLKIVDTTTGQIGWDTTADLSVVAPLYWLDSAHTTLAVDTTGFGGGGGSGSVSAGDTIVLNVHTNAYNDGRYYPRSSNPDGFLTTFTEADPLSVHITDSASMLNPYLHKTDTTAKWLTGAFRRNDSVFVVKGGLEIFAYKIIPIVIDTLAHIIYKQTNNGYVPALTLADTIAATSIVDQSPPTLKFIGNKWNGATSLRDSLELFYKTGSFPELQFRINGATKMTLASFPNLTIGGSQIFSSSVQTASVIASTYNGGTANNSVITLQSNGVTPLVSLAQIQMLTGTVQTTSGYWRGLDMLPTINEISATTDNTVLRIAPYEQSVPGPVKAIDIGTRANSGLTSSFTSKTVLYTNGDISISTPITTTNGSSPSYTLGTGAGSGASCTITGSDAAGYISITTGATPTAGGDVVTISFSTALTNTPTSVQLTAANENAAVDYNKVYVDQSSASTSSILIKNISTAALQASTTYKFYYTITQ